MLFVIGLLGRWCEVEVFFLGGMLGCELGDLLLKLVVSVNIGWGVLMLWFVFGG